MKHHNSDLIRHVQLQGQAIRLMAVFLFSLVTSSTRTVFAVLREDEGTADEVPDASRWATRSSAREVDVVEARWADSNNITVTIDDSWSESLWVEDYLSVNLNNSEYSVDNSDITVIRGGRGNRAKAKLSKPTLPEDMIIFNSEVLYIDGGVESGVTVAGSEFGGARRLQGTCQFTISCRCPTLGLGVNYNVPSQACYKVGSSNFCTTYADNPRTVYGLAQGSQRTTTCWCASNSNDRQLRHRVEAADGLNNLYTKNSVNSAKFSIVVNTYCN